MTTTYCAEKVKLIITEKLGLQEQILTEDLSFHNDLCVDSLDLCEVIWAVEKKFKVSIPDEEMEQISTIGDLISYVDERVAA